MHFPRLNMNGYQQSWQLSRIGRETHSFDWFHVSTDAVSVNPVGQMPERWFYL